MSKTVSPDVRCVFVECPSSGGSSRCPDEPVYRVWFERCRQCAEAMGIRCTGHWACIRHGAEVRGGELDNTAGDALVVLRIASLQRGVCGCSCHNVASFSDCGCC